jgi:hypothetical protein
MPWLVTWESAGGRAATEIREPIAAILSGRMSGRQIAQILEYLYASRYYTPAEWLAWAKTGTPPYHATLGELGGHTWEGEVSCGHNPYLYARKVDDLRFRAGADGAPKPHWKERARPSIPEVLQPRAPVRPSGEGTD